MRINKYISNLTLVLLLLSLLSILSYAFFHFPLYIFHKVFLNKYTAGLSLTKPLLFFFFLFTLSLVKDLLPKIKFTFRKWLSYQVIIIAGFVLLALLGFLVFKQNIETYNTAFPQQSIATNEGMLMYTSYEAKTLFFYSMSNTNHHHENKALFFPLTKHLGIEGDMGESIYPFYPTELRLLGYLLLAIVITAIILSIGLLKSADRKLNILFFFYYAFILWRLFHIVIDGGLFDPYFAYDMTALFFFTTIIAYVNYPHKKTAIFAPYVIIIVFPLLRSIVHAPFTIFFEVKVDFGSSLLMLFLFEMLLILSAVTFLTKDRPKKQITLTRFQNDKFTLLACFLTIIILLLYVQQLSSINVRTALDPVESYKKFRPPLLFLTVTTSSAENPCNENPIEKYTIKNNIIHIYRLSPLLKCQTNKKYYAYPLIKDEYKQGFLIIDCKTEKQNVKRKGDICYITLPNNYTFFRFSAATALQDQHIFWAFRAPK